GKLQTGGSAHGIAEDIGGFEFDGVHEGGDVVGEVGIGDGAVDIGGAAVALKLDGVNAVGFGQHGDDFAHGGDVHIGAMQDDERGAFARHLVIHVHAVD